MGTTTSRSSCEGPPDIKKLTEDNMKQAHNNAMQKITKKYDAIMRSSDTQYDKAVKVQNLATDYDVSSEFTNILEANGVDLTTICAKNGEILQKKQDDIKNILDKDIKNKTVMLSLLNDEVNSIKSMMKANMILTDDIENYKRGILKTFADDVERLINNNKLELSAISKESDDNLAIIQNAWDAEFKAINEQIDRHLYELGELSSQIGTTIEVNEKAMKKLNIDYSTEIVDTHIKNYKKLFEIVSDENNAFDNTYKSDINDAYSTIGKLNEYDESTGTRIKSAGAWMLRLYFISCIVLVYIVARNGTFSRNMKIAIISTAIIYPFVIHYIESYIYRIVIFILENSTVVTGDYRFKTQQQ
jgi:hypothetical protein